MPNKQLKAIANKAIERKTGARGLRSIMENVLIDTMFILPNLEDVEEVVISADVVDEKAQPLYIYGEKAVQKGNASAQISHLLKRRPLAIEFLDKDCHLIGMLKHRKY